MKRIIHAIYFQMGIWQIASKQKDRIAFSFRQSGQLVFFKKNHGYSPPLDSRLLFCCEVFYEVEE